MTKWLTVKEMQDALDRDERERRRTNGIGFLSLRQRVEFQECVATASQTKTKAADKKAA